jgi:hypothetical protein
MITSLKTNARAKNRDLEFTKPIVVITGDNQAGKTSILDSLTLALVGHIPRLGKTNEKLSSVIGWSGVLDIHAEVPDSDFGGTIKRKFRLSGNEVDGYKKSADKEPLCSAALDARSFLSSGPTARIEIIQRALGASLTISPADVRNIIQKSITDAGGQHVLSKGKPSLNESLDLWWDEVAQQTKMLNDQIARYAGSALTNMETSDSPPEYSADDHSKVMANRNDLDARLADIDRKINTHDVEIQRAQAVLEAFNFTDEAEIIKLTLKLEELRRQSIDNAGKMVECETKDTGDHKCPTCGQDVRHTVEQSDEWHALDQKSVEIAGAIAELEDELSGMKPPALKAKHDDIIKAGEAAILELQSLREQTLTFLDCSNAALADYEAQEAALKAWDIKQELDKQVQRSREQAEINLEAMKAAKSALDKLYKESTEKVLGPVMGVANQLLVGILPHPLTHRGFNLGYWTPEEKWVPIEGFCGAEEAAATIAFTAALASTDKLKIAILDEVGNLDERILKRFIVNLEQAIKHKTLDQVFLAGVRIDPEDSELVQVISL